MRSLQSRDKAELINLARQETFIVFGSPLSNPATEILLSDFFGATPLDNSNRAQQIACFHTVLEIVIVRPIGSAGA